MMAFLDERLAGNTGRFFALLGIFTVDLVKDPAHTRNQTFSRSKQTSKLPFCKRPIADVQGDRTGGPLP